MELQCNLNRKQAFTILNQVEKKYVDLTSDYLKVIFSLTDDYLISKDYNCQERDAYCARIGKTCICQCFFGYNITNGHCLSGKIFISEFGR